MAFIPDEDLKVLKNDVTEIKTLLKGYNGYKGLCEDYKDLKSDFYKFRNYSIVVFVFLLGSGTLGVGIYKLVELLH